MLTKWALKATTHNVRRVAWVLLVIGTGVLAAVVDLEPSKNSMKIVSRA